MNSFDKHIEWLTSLPNNKAIPLFFVEYYILTFVLLFTGYEFVKWLIS